MKKNVNKPIKYSTLLFLLILLGGLFLNQRQISQERRTIEQTEQKQEKSLPPSLAVITIAFGPLRGLVANAVWWRIIEQQDQGNYFEINQLADWITIMQPRNPQVWTYQSWNLAYNISFEFPEAKSKWQWIYRGLDLLTNQALKYNPDNKKIKTEIANLFLNRIGHESDASIKYYQQQWALMVYPFIPNGNRRDLQHLASAPDSIAGLRAIKPIQQLLEQASKCDLDLLNPNEFYAQSKWTARQRKAVEKAPDFRKLLQKLDAFHKAAKLREKFNLDPKRMLYLDEQYGPLDWRLYQAYAIYWAATCSFEEYCKHPITFEPIIRRALQNSFMDGKLIFDPEKNIFITTNNLRIIGKLHDYYDYILEHNYSPQADALHKSFLIKASAILYTFNELEAAKEVYHHYYEDYEKGKPQDFERFIANNLYNTLHSSNFKNSKSIIESALFQAYNWMATGDMKRALGYANFAKLLWNRHQKRNKKNPARLLPSFDSLKAAAYNKMMSSSAAQQFKDNLQKASSVQNIDHDNLEKVYIGHSIESGKGHMVLRKTLEEKANKEKDE